MLQRRGQISRYVFGDDAHFAVMQQHDPEVARKAGAEIVLKDKNGEILFAELSQRFGRLRQARDSRFCISVLLGNSSK